MKGLFLHSFYSAIGNIRLFLSIVLTVGMVLVITSSPTAQELFIYITITALSVNAVVSSRKDAASKWNKYELTMPVRRKDIVKCKYLTYLFWVAAGTLLSLIITAITMIVHHADIAYGINSLYSMFALGIGISLLSGALFYPLSYLVGIEKSETVLIISVLFGIGTSIAALHVLNQFTDIFAVRISLFVAFYLIVFGASYLRTLSIYQKQEF